MDMQIVSLNAKEKKGNILVVDDEINVREILKDILGNEGYNVTTVHNGIEALRLIKENPPDLVLTDMMMPEMGGMELLYQINNLRTTVTTIMMTGFATIETAVEAIKQGAYDYIMKPFKFADLNRILEHAMEKQRLDQENMELKETVALYDINKAISSNLNIEVILDMLVDALLKEGKADAVGLCLMDVTLSAIISTKVRAKNDRFADEVRSFIGSDASMTLLDSKESAILEGEDVQGIINQGDLNTLVESLLAIPILIKKQTVGIVGLFSFTRGYRFTEGMRKYITVLVSNVSVALENARLYEDIVNVLRGTVSSFARTLDAKDKYASGHSERVTRYSLEIAKEMSLSQGEIDTLAQAGILHDIGKIGVSELLLNKQGHLEWDEYEETKLHPIIGRDILAPISQFEEIAEVVLYHHERFDGKGYPEGLSGEKIPLLSRVIAVADTFDAMTTNRAYREKVGLDNAIEEIERNSGTQFDSEVVKAFLKIVRQLDIDDSS